MSNNLTNFLITENFIKISKNVNRKVQGLPQLQAAAYPWHQEEEKKDS